MNDKKITPKIAEFIKNYQLMKINSNFQSNTKIHSVIVVLDVNDAPIIEIDNLVKMAKSLGLDARIIRSNLENKFLLAVIEKW